jgi:hypothetical protein
MFAMSVAFPYLPTCFFLDAIKEIHDKNTSLSIYPKKKQAGETYTKWQLVHTNILAGVGIGILECE